MNTRRVCRKAPKLKAWHQAKWFMKGLQEN